MILHSQYSPHDYLPSTLGLHPGLVAGGPLPLYLAVPPDVDDQLLVSVARLLLLLLVHPAADRLDLGVGVKEVVHVVPRLAEEKGGRLVGLERGEIT